MLDALGEIADDDTWRKRRPRLDRVHLVTMATSAGQIAQRSAATPGRQTVPRALDLPAPPPDSWTSPSPTAADPRSSDHISW